MRPAEIRGEFQPIETNVPGIQICEHLPRLARIMDKLVPIRTDVWLAQRQPRFVHLLHRPLVHAAAARRLAFGRLDRIEAAWVRTNEAIPPFVGLAPKTGHPPYGSPGHPGFLGAAAQLRFVPMAKDRRT